MHIATPLKIGALGLLAALVIGCGGSDATPSPEPTPSPTPEAAALVIEASEFKYDPTDLAISSAGSSTISLVNKGFVEHDFTIDELDFQIAVVVGETSEGTLTDAAPGEYEFYCTIPGHKAAGMVGTLTVEA
ncbi:MAG: cupredoxin domain-containing protein [Chloroflexota bacterium]|nr:cupredoxin domain-containing protein [Chloroflexota bacterium]